MQFLLAFILTFLTIYLNPSSPKNPNPFPPTFPTAPTPTDIPSKIIIPQSAPETGPWGVAQKIGEHTYQIKVQNDSVMGTPEEILAALNILRARSSAQPLKSDPRLCQFATSRAEYQNRLGKTDAHAGFVDYLENQDGFQKLGFGHLGENSSFGYILSGTHLIEWVYMRSPEHNANQTDPKWDHACAGVFGLATNIVFATSPL